MNEQFKVGSIYKNIHHGYTVMVTGLYGDKYAKATVLKHSEKEYIGSTIEVHKSDYEQVVKSKQNLSAIPGVEQVIFNGRTVIVYANGGKGVSTCSEDDYYDPFVGFCVAYATAIFFQDKDTRNNCTVGNKSKLKSFVTRLFNKSQKKKER